MIIARTPLRISISGGGTDLPAYYSQREGAIVAFTIDKYVHVIVKRHFDSKRVIDSAELVGSMFGANLNQELVREAMKKTGVRDPLEVAVFADVPAGSGLGGGSCVTVGLLSALYAYRGLTVMPQRIAEEASEIEIDALGMPVGKQDQYVCAIGGFLFIKFDKHGNASVEKIQLSEMDKEALMSHLQLFYMASTRSSASILSEQKEASIRTQSVLEMLDKAKQQSFRLRDSLMQRKWADIGMVWHEAWESKKQLMRGVSQPHIDMMVETAYGVGAEGVKVMGAGGGGFLLVFCPQKNRKSVSETLSELGLHELPFVLESQGTRVDFNA